MGGKAPPATQSVRDEIHAVTVTYKCYTDLTKIMPVFLVNMKKWGWVKSGRRRHQGAIWDTFCLVIDPVEFQKFFVIFSHLY